MDKLKRFMVTAVVETDFHCYVMARDKEHALELADDMGVDEMIVDNNGVGDFRLCDADEVQEGELNG